MELKKNEDGQVVLSEDGFPVYIDKDGKEIIPNIPKLMDDLKSANKESAGRRKELEALKRRTQLFEGELGGPVS